MTNEEAILILRNNKPTSDTRLCGKELCEAVDGAIEALEKADKYKWHDLRKNPDDLPSDDYRADEWYECVHENHIYDSGYPSYQFDGVNFGYRHDIFHPISLGYVDSEFKSVEDMGYEKIIAWRLVELFEEGDENENG